MQSAWLDVTTAPAEAAVPVRRSLPSRAVVHAVEARPTSDRVAFLEPLTPKELEVLGCLSELPTTEEIAARLFVSVNTVRTHIRNILRKLAVRRRNEAVRLGRDLRLIAAS